MPSAIDSTAKSTTGNSYVSLTEANAYFDDRLYASAWSGASTDDKTRALLMAAQHIDAVVDWDESMAGYRTTMTQAMQWPRTGALTRDGDNFVNSDTVPDFVKDFQCEVALGYLAKDRTADASARGISSVTAGPVSVSFDGGVSNLQQLIPDTAWQLIAPWVENPGPSSPNALNVVELVR